MKHVMIDLETLGTSPDSVFLSVAAVQFDLSGKMGREFSMNVELESALKKGRKISSGTLQWWLAQRPEIMKRMFDEPTDLEVVLFELSKFFVLNGITTPWGNSASFDLGMLNHAYEAQGVKAPWTPWQERCYRTAWGILAKFPHTKKNYDAHDPLVDCRYQIQELARLNLVESSIKD